MARSTRESILTATAELMRHRGYGAVGMKDIAAASGAPIGSLYHHFRGGKVQIAREALVNAGAAYAMLIPTVVDGYTDLGAALEGVFEQAAQDMAATGFANMCPIASVAAEVADTVAELREVSAGIFTGWLDGGTAYFTARGLPAPTARQVTVALVAALEGAFVLARTMRDTEPLLAAGRVLGPQFRGVALTAAAPAPAP
ncbi:TetR/AcrR family transcriptional regulator [Mycolicibacterium litorale]|uniref:Transcriptional regulator, TetR family protein n=1 Tax=Mycolicibacterium litorale TaxID=758802 RepID=A0AAD1MTP9_9MYCO|nr:TetR/AcrR family transcriptional regulator [Mycolicibacterium litorale]MCV7415216.1 TetR/AcrR family transcriptional regulator [Mycolicibacterium litorale]TDY08470.1 TetR family transcriptional regulator [Mycolicibacterium litorale]BBY16393.1 putative transcriptional regulator, TetR family protein [Mycolicibacterium litorale]